MEKKQQQLVNRTAQVLRTNHSKEMDIDDRIISFGPGGVKNLIGEEDTTSNISFTVTNKTLSDQIVAFFPVGHSQFADVANDNFDTIFGTSNVLKDGLIIDGAVAGEDLEAECNDSDTSLNRIVRYVGLNPTRITSALFETSNVDGSPNTANFNNVLRTIWINPFGKPVETKIPLRKYLSQAANSPQYLEVPFIKDGLMVMISSEHGLIFEVKKGTSLHVNLSVGGQLSVPQLAYRKFRAADAVLGPMRSRG